MDNNDIFNQYLGQNSSVSVTNGPANNDDIFNSYLKQPASQKQNVPNGPLTLTVPFTNTKFDLGQTPVIGQPLETGAKDLMGILGNATAGMEKGLTLGAVNPEKGTIGVPILQNILPQTKIQIAQPMAQQMEQKYGISKGMAENPYAEIPGEIAGSFMPVGVISRGVSAGMDAAGNLLGKGAELANVGQTARNASRLAQLGGRLANAGITGGIVGASNDVDSGNSMLNNIKNGAIWGAGSQVVLEGLNGIVTASKLPGKYQAVNELKQSLSDWLYGSGKYDTPEEAQSAASNMVDNDVKRMGGVNNIDKGYVKDVNDIVKNQPVNLSNENTSTVDINPEIQGNNESAVEPGKNNLVPGDRTAQKKELWDNLVQKFQESEPASTKEMSAKSQAAINSLLSQIGARKAGIENSNNNSIIKGNESLSGGNLENESSNNNQGNIQNISSGNIYQNQEGNISNTSAGNDSTGVLSLPKRRGIPPYQLQSDIGGRNAQESNLVSQKDMGTPPGAIRENVNRNENVNPPKVNEAGFSVPEIKDYSKEVPQSTEENLSNGSKAIDKVIKEKADVLNAMYRPELGSISFYWGEPGTPGKNYKDGYGMSHLIARRNLEDGVGETVARKMAEVISKGDIIRQYGPPSGERANIEYDGHTAVLSLYKQGNRKTWLLTGWKNYENNQAPGVTNGGYGPLGTTSSGPMRTRPEGGASASKNIITQNSEKNNPSSGPVMQSAIIPGLKEFTEQDIIPRGNALVDGLKESLAGITHLVTPTANVPMKAMDMVMQMKGERDKQNFKMERTMSGVKKIFNKMPVQDQVAFVDRYKTGQEQPTPELKQVADFYHKADEATFKELSKYNPSLTWKEDHFRVMWKQIPGKTESGFQGLFRGPLQGSKGMFKHSTLSDMSEGIKRGGVPYSYNPQVLFETAQADALRYISAQRMWAQAKEDGFVKFIRPGQAPPDGFVRLNDRIAKVYFAPDIKINPALEHYDQNHGTNLANEHLGPGHVYEETGANMEKEHPGLGDERVRGNLAQMGEYWVEPNLGRILNNYLSKDWIRTIPITRGLLAVKNFTTGIELAFSPFHFTFESLEAMASKFGMGLTRAANNGIRQGNINELKKGIQEMAMAPAGPVQFARTGSQAIKYFTNPTEFLKTTGGQNFIKRFPDAAQMIDDLFTGGGKLAMHEDYKITSTQALLESINSNNYIGATLRLLPSINEQVMRPLFEVYIPRLKVGAFLQEYSQQLIDFQDELAAGKITRATLARQTWNRVENRFGEMNFDNQFWNRTFKSSLQLLFRSVTWKLGTIKQAIGAAPEQANYFWNAIKDKSSPRISPKISWLFGVIVTSTVLAEIIQRSFTGENIQGPKDVIAPKIGGKDNHGYDVRGTINTYLKDLYSMYKGPMHYISSSLSGMFGRMVEVLNNKDYFGNQVYGQDESVLGKIKDSILHMVPLPFTLSNNQQSKGYSTSGGAKLLMEAGVLNPAPNSINQTKAQELMYNYLKGHQEVAGRTPEQAQQSQKASQLTDQLRQHQITPQDVIQAYQNKEISRSEVRSIIRSVHINPLITSFRRLSPEEMQQVFNAGTPDEKRLWYPYYSRKMATQR